MIGNDCVFSWPTKFEFLSRTLREPFQVSSRPLSASYGSGAKPSGHSANRSGNRGREGSNLRAKSAWGLLILAPCLATEAEAQP